MLHLLPGLSAFHSSEFWGLFFFLRTSSKRTKRLSKKSNQTFICDRMNCQQTKEVNSAQQTRDTTTETWLAYGDSTWHASKYRVHKLHQRNFLFNCVSLSYDLHGGRGGINDPTTTYCNPSLLHNQLMQPFCAPLRSNQIFGRRQFAADGFWNISVILHTWFDWFLVCLSYCTGLTVQTQVTP